MWHTNIELINEIIDFCFNLSRAHTMRLLTNDKNSRIHFNINTQNHNNDKFDAQLKINFLIKAFVISVRRKRNNNNLAAVLISSNITNLRASEQQC